MIKVEIPTQEGHLSAKLRSTHNCTLGGKEVKDSFRCRVEAIFNCTINIKRPEFHEASFIGDLGNSPFFPASEFQAG